MFIASCMCRYCFCFLQATHNKQHTLNSNTTGRINNTGWHKLTTSCVFQRRLFVSTTVIYSNSSSARPARANWRKLAGQLSEVCRHALSRGSGNAVEMAQFEISNSMKPHPSVVHAHTSELRPVWQWYDLIWYDIKRARASVPRPKGSGPTMV